MYKRKRHKKKTRQPNIRVKVRKPRMSEEQRIAIAEKILSKKRLLVLWS